MSWLDSVRGESIVLKLGGNAITDRSILEGFAHGVGELLRAGVKVAIVHGGGPQISQALEAEGIPTEFIDGLRVSSKEALPIIRDVLMKEISVPLAELISQQGYTAKALNGFTEDLMLAELTRPDLGYVGEVFAVRDGYLRKIMAEGQVPVISSVAPSEDGDLINVNADLAAASIAVAIGAVELVLLTDVDGLYGNWPDKDSLLSTVTSGELENLVPSLEAGMIPKAQAALAALYGGVKVARIINGSKDKPLSSLLAATDVAGTEVVS